MATGYVKFPFSTPSIFANLAAFPTTAPDGTLAVALDTHTLYMWDQATLTWQSIGGTSTVEVIGPIDSQSPSANGAVIVGNALIMQSASATVPGLVNNAAQTFSGVKNFTSQILAASGSANAPGFSFNGNGNVGMYNASGILHFATNGISAAAVDASQNWALVGTVSASNLSGTNTGDVTLGTANGLSIPGQVLSLQLASTSLTGALSSTDWNTFNGKQSSGSYITALTGDVSASGPGSSAATLASTISGAKIFSTSLQSPFFISSTANPASSGVVQLANTDLIKWRNAANSSNLALGVNASNLLVFQSTALVDISSAQTLSNKVLTGVTDGSVAGAGAVGEILIFSLLTNTNTGTTGAYFDAVSGSITAGCWDLQGTIQYAAAGATLGNGHEVGISVTTGNSNTGQIDTVNWVEGTTNPNSTENQSVTTPTYRINISTPTTHYLKGLINFTLGQPQYKATLRATRIR